MVNRSVVILRAKEPFFQWLRSLPDPVELTPEDYDDDSTAYLIPHYWDNHERDELLKQIFDFLFIDVLSGWWTEESDWPQNRDLQMFQEWFTCEFHSLLIDLVADPLIREEDE